MAFNRFAALACGSALVAVAMPAFAQGNASPADADAVQAEEIVVTANKREERLQDVPLAVSVIGGDQLTSQNINEVTDLTRSTPALNNSGPFGALSIRGVGSVSFARSAEGSVGVVVDGVALANTSTNPPQLFDIQRVEVLEGPQGTLFGRNSSAGVVNITTNAPDADKWEVIAHADIGEDQNYIGRAVVNVPVASNAALRVSGSYSQPPRRQHNNFDDSWHKVKGKTARARFLWEPIDDLTFNVIGDYSQFDRKGGVPWAVYLSTPGSRLTQRLVACGVDIGPENEEGCIDGGNDQTSKSFGISGQVDARIGDHTITSISAYRGFKSIHRLTDADSVPVNRLNVNESPREVHNLSQEFRLTSPTGGLVDYVLGLYYFDSTLQSTNTQRGLILADLGVPFPIGQVQSTRSTTTSYAAFGNATINVTPDLHILVGARYGREEVAALTTGRLAPGAVAPILSTATISGQVEDTYFSYRVGAQFDISPDAMIYGTYTRGYKGPSVNDQTGTGNIPKIIRPEIPHASEIGVKVNAFDGRLTASLAGFYNRIDDFQAQFFLPSAGAFVFGNAPELKTKGISFNLLGQPMRGLTLNAGVLYNDAKYGSGYLVACAQGQTAAQGCLNPRPGVFVDDAGGNRLVGAPEWKVTAFAEYEAALSDTLTGFVQGDMVYTSKINWDAAFSPQNTSEGAAIFGGRAGVRFDEERFGFSIFARNIFDKYRPAVRFATPTARQQLDPLSFSQISGPESRRTVGVSLDARF